MVFTGGWPGRQGGAAKVNTSVHSGLAVSVGTAGDTLGEGHFPRGPATWGQCWGGGVPHTHPVPGAHPLLPEHVGVRPRWPAV